MKERSMKREHWACLGAGSGATGAALCVVQGQAIGVLVFAALLIASLLAAHSVDVQNSPRQPERSGK
jgi:hypothetical protein